MAWLGQAYDLKVVSPKVVEQRAARTGDGSYVKPGAGAKEHEHENGGHENGHSHGHSHSHGIDTAWGWGDEDISTESILATDILYPSKGKSL